MKPNARGAAAASHAELRDVGHVARQHAQQGRLASFNSSAHRQAAHASCLEGVCAAAEVACKELLATLGHAGEAPPTEEEITKMVNVANGIFGIGHAEAVTGGPIAKMTAGEEPGATG